MLSMTIENLFRFWIDVDMATFFEYALWPILLTWINFHPSMDK